MLRALAWLSERRLDFDDELGIYTISADVWPSAAPSNEPPSG